MQWKAFSSRKDEYRLQIRREFLQEIFSAKRNLLLSSQDQAANVLRKYEKELEQLSKPKEHLHTLLHELTCKKIEFQEIATITNIMSQLQDIFMQEPSGRTEIIQHLNSYLSEQFSKVLIKQPIFALIVKQIESDIFQNFFIKIYSLTQQKQTFIEKILQIVNDSIPFVQGSILLWRNSLIAFSVFLTDSKSPPDSENMTYKQLSLIYSYLCKDQSSKQLLFDKLDLIWRFLESNLPNQAHKMPHINDFGRFFSLQEQLHKLGFKQSESFLLKILEYSFKDRFGKYDHQVVSYLTCNFSQANPNHITFWCKKFIIYAEDGKLGLALLEILNKYLTKMKQSLVFEIQNNIMLKKALKKTKMSDESETRMLSSHILKIYYDQLPQKTRVSQNAQRAILATAMIMLIITPHPPKTVCSPSIAFQLQNIEVQKYFISENVREETFQLFKGGVQIDKKFLQQVRIKNATCSFNEPFVYYPNYTVTSPIFDKLYNPHDKELLTGSFGMGKTISITLFLLLSNIIHKYAVKAHQSCQGKSQYSRLLSDKAIFKVKKYWYWSIDTDQVKENRNNPSFLKDIILDQASQLSQSDIAELKAMNIDNMASLFKQITSKYNGYSPTYFVIIDQINSVTSVIKNWNYFLIQKRQELEAQEQDMDKSLEQTLQGFLQDYYQPAVTLKALVKQFFQFSCNKFILNSSTTLEIDSLYNIQTTKWPFQQLKSLKKYRPLSLQIGTYSPKKNEIQIYNVTEQMHENIDMKLHDGWNFFWFQILRNLPFTSELLNSQIQQRVKYLFLQRSSQWSLTKYSFLFMRLYLKQHWGKKQLKLCCKQPTETRISNRLFQFIKQFQAFCFQKNKERLCHFLQKSNKDIRIRLLKALVIYAEELIAKGITSFELGLDNFRRILNTNIVIDKFFIQDSHDSEPIPLRFDLCSRRITIEWSPSQLIEITEDIIFPTLRTSFLSEFNLYCLATSAKERGIRMQNFITYLLQKDSELSFLMVENVNQWKNMKIKIHAKRGFQAFNQNFQKKVYDIRGHLDKVFQSCRQSPQLWIAGVPCSVLPQIQENPDGELNLLKYRYNSQAIDFLIAKYNCISETYEIYTFDATISTSKMGDKFKDSKNFFTKLTKPLIKKEIKDIRITHVILSPQKECKSTININQILRIKYSSIDKLRIRSANPKLKEVIKDFRQVQRLIIGIREEEDDQTKKLNMQVDDRKQKQGLRMSLSILLVTRRVLKRPVSRGN